VTITRQLADRLDAGAAEVLLAASVIGRRRYHRQEPDMSFRISPLAAALALAGITTPVAAQSAALALTAAPVPIPLPGALKPAYHLRLTSQWPQQTVTPGCRNGGEETLDGTLTQNAEGAYSGTFTRHTELLFCGAHGAAAASCSLALGGEGTVAMIGAVMRDETSPSGRSVRVTWTPAPGHDAQVTGECADTFKQAVRAMYLSTPHAAEFPLTTVGAAPMTERLENYAWEVELD
jgi:hypothetical protein